MLQFQWNALRVGEHVAVHDDSSSALELGDGVVSIVGTRVGGANDIGIRLDADGSLKRPRRDAVHLLPIDRRFSCWRCDLSDRHAAAA